MNDFTKTDLREIHRCLKYMTTGGLTPYSCHTLALVKKVRTIIENYCEHDPRDTKGAIGMYHCPVCGDMQLAGFPHIILGLDDENQ